ncbi:YALIA101S01e08768g1_1 [Yarrowia lipolytica]|nr:YALIA101S01e08768g1_1 [Yarrowia lipolytica]
MYPTTGVNTPQSAASLRPLVLSHGQTEHSLLVPTSLYINCTTLRDQFYASLPPATEDKADDDEPSSSTELLAAFLGFTAKTVEEEPGPYDDVLSLVLNEFETRYLRGNDIHAVASSLLQDEDVPTTVGKIKRVIRAYYAARIACNRPIKAHSSALFRAASEDSDNVSLYAIFGGQGNTEDYFEELREIYDIYQGLVGDFIRECGAQLLALSRDHIAAEKIYTKGFDIVKWLEHPETIPDFEYLISAPISVPIIGVIQLAHYAVTCRVLGLNPGQVRDNLKGATGHSQGLITAIAISASDSWDEFYNSASRILKIFFFIGVRVQQAYPSTFLPPSTLEDSVKQGEGKPTPMLSIRDLSLNQVQEFVDATNLHLPEDKQIVVSLINGPRNVVVTGPPQSLYGLCLVLRKQKAETGLDQSRVPHSQRKLKFTHRFLPITSPFHSYLLEKSTDLIINDLESSGVEFVSSELKVPVYDTFDGSVLSQLPKGIVSRLVNLITHLPVKWEKATQFQASHIVDFGPGGASGLGLLTHKNKDGTGVRTILAGVIDQPLEFGFKQELFDRQESSIVFAQNWAKEFSPKLVKISSTNEVYVDTKFSRLTGRAPIMVAGMTPTTVNPKFVAATMNSGYHIELGGGGYFAPGMMTKALEHIEKNTPPGSGITINLIYVNPRLIQWGIPLIQELRQKGFPIEGLTIGAGVPSLEVANEWIQDLGVKHIAFKPGSIEAISSVIRIAKANPDFPIILQWTGGRGGGHHSFEDFHAPILQMYSKIRRCSNIVLIAGSGFGASTDSYPYLTGSWSRDFDYPPMPFDGILVGSRVMVAKEAFTSLGAKQLIVDSPGVEDSEWEKTYDKPTGGVITVLSEMGEPIHKLATRGVLFWHEMDKTVFSLPKKKRLEVLKSKRAYIIKRLNDDFQKTWFAKNAQGQVCDLEDLTYAEVIQRLVDLMYVKKESRWIDVTLRNLAGTFIRRVEERFSTETGASSVLQSFSELDSEPEKVVERVFELFPASTTQIINAQDKDHFLMLCLNPMQKPVPFIPVLDDNFEFFFKKDSLWQCEDLAAVVDEDVGRICILQGPVAVKHSKIVNEPVKEILDSMHEGHIKQLLEDGEYAGNMANIPQVECFGGKPAQNFGDVALDSVMVLDDLNKTVFKIETGTSALPSAADWFSLLAGDKNSWRQVFLSTDTIVQTTKMISNPLHRLLEPIAGLQVEIEHPDEPENTVISAFEPINGKVTKVLELRKGAGDVISLQLIEARGVDRVPVALPLEFKYQPQIGYAPIVEVMTDRNTRIKEFYWKLWFGQDSKFEIDTDITEEIIGDDVTISGKAIADFVHAVGNKGEAFVGRSTSAGTVFAPMDFAIVLGWKAIIKAIFPRAIDADILRLVHLSNGFKMMPGADPLQMGDVVSATAKIDTVKNSATGKTVAVRGLLTRDGKPVMEVVSEFFYRGEFSDFQNTFERREEVPMQLTLKDAKAVAILCSKEWFEYNGDDTKDLEGKTIVFRNSSFIKYKNETVFSSVHTTGKVLMELPSKEVIEIATVNYQAGESHGNPVIDYLERNGTTIEQPVEFEKPIPLSKADDLLSFKAPSSNEPYAGVSGDYNPIHVSRAFASYASLPGTITHGMYSSAAVRSLIEVWAAENNVSRVRAFSCQFQGMVLPNDEIVTRLEHVGMINGRKIIKVTSTNRETEAVVLSGEAEVEQPISTFVFTGQGSQEQGMGMDLYASSEVAKKVWDKADEHFLQNYGFSIIKIVVENPKELDIHFGGPKGKKIRDNYISMMFETIDEKTGNLISEKIFKEIDETTDSFTFKSPTGLLSATQFTQPALTLMEKASFEDMKAKGLVPVDATFAGHSLGEYSALASLGDVMPIESLVDVVFYRGMTMQVAVPRDAQGRSNYGMCAVNPSRISTTFNDAALRFVVDHISEQTKWLLEIVNYNVENSQYVTAGDLRALDTLTNVLNVLKLEKINIDKLLESLPLEKVKEHLSEIVTEVAKKSVAKPQPIELERGFAVIPLKGISVPFHSSYLRNGVKPFQNFLVKKVPKNAVKPANLIGKYIPNLTAKPFEITKEYFEEVYKLTGSEKVKSIIDNWESYESK